MSTHDREQHYKIALNRLNKEYSAPIIEKYPTLQGLDATEINSLQDQIVSSINKQDRFKVYHITKVDKIDYESLKELIGKRSFKYDFLKDNNYSDWSIKANCIDNKSIEFSFIKFTKKEIKNPNETDRLSTPLVKIPYYFQFKAEFKQVDNIDILVLSFPAFKPMAYGTYEFGPEINYIYSWVNNVNISLAKTEYKEVFDSLCGKTFDKFGFKGEDLRADNEIIKSVFTFKHNKHDESSETMHEAIDKLVGQEVVDTIISGLSGILEEQNDELSIKTEEAFTNYLYNIGFSRHFFNLIQMGCEHGVGYAKHKSEPFVYNLEYTKTGEGLIRSRTEKWVSIRPVYDEVIKYFKST